MLLKRFIGVVCGLAKCLRWHPRILTLNGRPITSPKTEKGIRRVLMPDFYADKMQSYIESLRLNESDRIFLFTKSYLHHEIRRGCAASGVKRIRIHRIRHSHICLLIDMGFSAVAIADRVGHESIDITYRYAHVFPSTQQEIALKLSCLDSK